MKDTNFYKLLQTTMVNLNQKFWEVQLPTTQMIYVFQLQALCPK